MIDSYINLTLDNLAEEHLCCAIADKKHQHGVEAKHLPCVFNNWAVFYNGKFETVHLLNEGYLKKLI